MLDHLNTGNEVAARSVRRILLRQVNLVVTGVAVFPLLVLRAAPNSLLYSRFAFAVGRRVTHKAVIRNRVRRRIREVVRRSPVRPGWDLLFIARPSAAEASFTALREAVLNVERRAGLLESSSSPPEREAEE